MRIWRITKREHAAQAYSGIGSELSPGRWHSPPHRVVYAAENAPLAILEKLAWVRRLERLQDFVLVPADLPDDDVADLGDLPADWNAVPHRLGTRRLGDAWLEGAESLAAGVPSALAPGRNILLNPAHPDHARLSVGGAVPIPEALTTDRAAP